MHLQSAPTAFALLFCLGAKVTAQGNDPLLPCGDAFYHASEYICYPSNFLCPVLNGTPTLKCGGDCYLSNLYGFDFESS